MGFDDVRRLSLRALPDFYEIKITSPQISPMAQIKEEDSLNPDGISKSPR